MSRPKLLALLCLAVAVAPAVAVEPRPLAIVIHGGAGVIDPEKMTPERAASYRAGLAAALDAGYAILERGGTSLDAVEAAVRTMEDDLQFNAGRGALLGHDGDAELDAAIMDGSGPRAAAVHDGGVEFRVTIVAEQRAPAGVELQVVFHGAHRRLDGIEARAAALEDGVTGVERRREACPVGGRTLGRHFLRIDDAGAAVDDDRQRPRLDGHRRRDRHGQTQQREQFRARHRRLLGQTHLKSPL